MSRKTRGRKAAGRRRYVGYRESSDSGIVLPRNQEDVVIDALVPLLGEAQTESCLRAAEAAEESFVEHLWRTKALPLDQLIALCRTPGLVGETQLLKFQRGDQFDPCFVPEAWQRRAAAEPTAPHEQIAPIDESLTAVVKTCDEEELATGEGTGAIDEATPAVETELAPTVDFGTAAAAERVKGRLLTRATDQDIEDLTAMLQAAQAEAPEDKLGFVLEMRRMLAAGGLELRVAGLEGAVAIAMKNGSIGLSIRKGSMGFRRAELQVVRSEEPTFAPNKRDVRRAERLQGPSQ